MLVIFVFSNMLLINSKKKNHSYIESMTTYHETAGGANVGNYITIYHIASQIDRDIPLGIGLWHTTIGWGKNSSHTYFQEIVPTYTS